MKKLFLLACCVFILMSVRGEVKLPLMISDGMVLQRNISLPIWGWANPGETVKVTFNGKQYQCVTNDKGKWQCRLNPTKAGGPFEMVIKGSNQIVLKDLLVGDVWLCSGQSNMEFDMSRVTEKYSKELASSENSKIRQFLVKRRFSFCSRPDLESVGGWKPANPQNCLSFTAVGYLFARDLYERYKVPIGLINCTFGGTPAEAWVSEEVLHHYPKYYNQYVTYQNSNLVDSISARDKTYSDSWYAQINQKDQGSTQKWYREDLNDLDWKTMQLPNLWQKNGLPGVEGAVVWFRKEIDVPVNMTGQDATLRLGFLISSDSTWVNGQFVGRTTSRYLARNYHLNHQLLKPGKNIITVRLLNESGDGGFIRDKRYELDVENRSLSLTGEWKYRLGASSNPLKREDITRFQNMGGALYYGMLSPMIGYGIKGVIWYQGESNVGRAEEYKTLFKDLITGWRKDWNQGTFPFLFVQLASMNETHATPGESAWAELQAAQAVALELPKTGMAVANDLGEWNDVHPLNKLDVALRLSAAARVIAYGERNVVYGGPAVQSVVSNGNQLILTFSNVGGGLSIKGGGALKGFAVAGKDKQFVWADAKVVSPNKVILTNSSIADPVWVSYAWADNPLGANLYNKEGFPTPCFRMEVKK